MSKHKHKVDHEEHVDESWLIPYADVLTLLLALFIVLFASSSVDAKKYEQMVQAFNGVFGSGSGVLDGAVAPTVMEQPPMRRNSVNHPPMKSVQPTATVKRQGDLEQLQEVLETYISENELKSMLETELTMNNLKITFGEQALFTSGSAEVKPDASKLAAGLSQMLERYSDYTFVIAGHTDNVPIHNSQFQSNWDLSMERAVNFMKILLTNHKLNPEQFSVAGYGEYRPIADNDTEDNRSRNRRVELTVSGIE